MATYYVRNDGNNANTGLGDAAELAWQTITKAVSVMVSGDTCYVAPGFYGEMITLPSVPATLIEILGNPLADKFSGVEPGEVVISGSNSLHTQAVRVTAIDFANKQGWAIKNFTILPGTQDTLRNIYNSTLYGQIKGCKIVGKISEAIANGGMGPPIANNEFIATTIINTSSTQELSLGFNIFHCLVITGNATFNSCFINLGAWTLPNNTIVSRISSCVVNVYPSFEDGFVIKDSTVNVEGYFGIRCSVFKGVGKVFKSVGRYLHFVRGNEIRNLDCFIDNNVNRYTSTNYERNTFYTCKMCLKASLVTNQITTSQYIYYLRCDSLTDGYVPIGAESVVGYGGRQTGVGGSGSFITNRLPFDSELVGVFTSLAYAIILEHKALVFRAAAEGVMQTFFTWIPVQAGVTRTVTFKVNESWGSTSNFWKFTLGIYNYTSQTLGTNEVTPYTTITMSYTPIETGYIPLIIAAPAPVATEEVFQSVVDKISDISWY